MNMPLTTRSARFTEPQTEQFPALTGSLTDKPRARRTSGGIVRHRVNRLFSVLAGLIALAILAVAAALTVVPAIAGGHTLTVLSGSMVPALPVGSVVVDRPVAASALHLGDIVTYSTTDPVSNVPILITHRIVGVRETATGPVFTIKGDANNTPDERPVTANQIRGKLWYDVPYIGVIRNELLSPGAALIAIAVLLFGSGCWLLYRTLWPRARDNATDDPGDRA
jgi:signal peptidase